MHGQQNVKIPTAFTQSSHSFIFSIRYLFLVYVTFGRTLTRAVVHSCVPPPHLTLYNDHKLPENRPVDSVERRKRTTTLCVPATLYDRPHRALTFKNTIQMYTQLGSIFLYHGTLRFFCIDLHVNIVAQIHLVPIEPTNCVVLCK